jgi:enoyl-CoA hydratase/carnithine racemase
MTGTPNFRIDPSRPGIWVITFSNPPINMLSPAAIYELQGLLTAAEAKPGLKVLIFDSADATFFISHFDTNAAASRPVTGGTELPWTDFVTRLSLSPLVSIARVRGRARGVGNEFVLACDLRYGSRKRAIFGNPEVGVGVVPGGGAVEWLPRTVGRSRALEVLLSGDDYDAETAERFGWLTRALEDHELDFFVDDLARRLASFDRETLAAIKAQVNRSDLPTADEIQSSNRLFWHGLGTPASQVRRARLGPLGYGEHSHFEINFGARLDELQPGYEATDALSSIRT